MTNNNMNYRRSRSAAQATQNPKPAWPMAISNSDFIAAYGHNGG